MARVDNYFVKGIMDSDTHYPMLDNKSFVLAENVRISGVGEDGAFKFMRGSANVSDYSENGTMQIIGVHRGFNNKSYIFLAHPNGKSKIIQYDVETGISKVIIQDNTVLRFDKIRWNNGTVIFPFRYLLSFNQIGNMIIFSNEVWENIRSVNLDRIDDYALGFTEEDITLNKKPPSLEPKIFQLINDPSIIDKTKKDRFVSFAYRYKYKDGDWSALSFYSDTAFEIGGNEVPPTWFKINSERINVGMTNKWNAVEIMVNSGGENVTEIEVIAREHNSNTGYIIYSGNKKKLNIPNNINTGISPNFPHILYKFSNNYKILSEDYTRLLYSNIAKFPKTQDVVGNRFFVANYKEGYDLIDNNGGQIVIDLDVRKDILPATIYNNNTTAVSLFSYSIGMVYYDDYNVSTTVLSNANQSTNDIDINFADRLHRNIIKVKPNHNPPSFATKFKFVVKAEQLNYEILYSHYARRVGDKVYLLLKNDNIEKLKQGDEILFTHEDYVKDKWRYIESVKPLTKLNDFVDIDGLYAVINDVEEEIILTLNIGAEGDYRKGVLRRVDQDAGQDINRFGWLFLDTNAGCQIPYTPNLDNFINYMNPPFNPSTTLNAYLNDLACAGVDYGIIRTNDRVKYTIITHYYRRLSNASADYDIATMRFDYSIIADREYANVDEFIFKNHTDLKFTMELPTGGKLIIKTNNYYVEFIQNGHPTLNDFSNETGKRLNVWFGLEVNLKRGVDTIWGRTKNKEVLNEYYFETPKSFKILQGQHIGAEADGYFNIGFYNGYCWGNGIESYKIKDAFNGKKLNYNFRPNAIEANEYKRVHRKSDISYSGIYNYELGINELSLFENTEANWKTLPIKHGEIKRIISTDGDITVFFEKKIINQFYGKSIISDLQGNESLALSNDVLGGYQELEYEIGVSDNPESIATNGNLIYAVDKMSNVVYLKQGNSLQVINGNGTGVNEQSTILLKESKSLFGSFNESKGEYILGFDHNKSIVFNLNNKGFTNYTTNKFEYNFGMNGKYFTAYKGVLYENEVTDFYNNFAGQGNFEAKVVFVVNPEIGSDKVFKAIYQQSDEPWKMELKTNLTSTINPENLFVKKESFWYSDIFMDITGDYTLEGIGNIKSINGNEVTFSKDISNAISSLDTLKSKTTNSQSKIIDIKKNVIFVESSLGFIIGEYAFAEKQSTMTYRPDGTPMRGKWMEVTMTKSGNEPHFINAVSTEIIKSYL